MANYFNKNSGFSLFEVMLAIIILSFTMIGTATMQAIALNLSMDSANRKQAVNISEEIITRMKASRVYLDSLAVSKFSNFIDDKSLNIYADAPWNDSPVNQQNDNNAQTMGDNKYCMNIATNLDSDEFLSSLNCRPIQDVVEISKNIKRSSKTNSTAVNKTAFNDYYVFMDCKDNSSSKNESGKVRCGPGSIYKLYVIWQQEEIINETSVGINNEQCVTKISQSLSSYTPDQFRKLDCLIMEFIP